MSEYAQIVLSSRPAGAPKLDDFRVESASMPVPSDGQLLLRTLFLSLDPYMRLALWPEDVQPVALGHPMPGEVVAEVIRSCANGYQRGDLVRAPIGWRTHAAVAPQMTLRVPRSPWPITAHLGVLGMPGFTAYVGVSLIGKPKRGETFVVASAAGAVGSLAGQIAKSAGARVVGIAGGPEKCEFLMQELGFDAAVDRQSKDLERELRDTCPAGIDVYFENVGGTVWQAVLPLLNPHARVPICGLVSLYNGVHTSSKDSWPELSLQVLRRSLVIRGFINSDFTDEYYGEFVNKIGPLVSSGQIRYHEHVVEGLEQAPAAFIRMLEGRSYGKVIVKVP
jgi:NADPH-dependent curcumin reductase